MSSDKMIINSLTANKYQSDYTFNKDKYRSMYRTNEIPAHRMYSADFWELTIPQILEYLKSNGLKPNHKILDLGAGALRSGLALIPYLDNNNYYAIDINKYLLEDGYKYEIIKNNLHIKFPLNNIKVTYDYNAEDFNTKFDYVWSFSLWTHLDISECTKCLNEISKILKPDGVYFTTCFIVNDSEYNQQQLRQSDVKLFTNPNNDPYHHTLSSMQQIANNCNMKVEYMGIGKCCPRKHDILKFTYKN